MPDGNNNDNNTSSTVENQEEHPLPHKIHHSDLTKEQTSQAVSISTDHLKNNVTSKDIAVAIKRQFEELHGGTWQVLVGSSFGCSITHETKAVLYFELTASSSVVTVLMFKSAE
mmetsp:Transcript_44380/g.53647  ORF Transcript_44380/g.53647 Transcript_44380/m.53647 type:complete len:114 (-) Transcript_44380:275-616(-)|eukprot:CAMPEP_0172515994 /NCGR_PEP_ID=MMETSP1066-20121228/272502_1 /TAXON_ID=671091 /ORGANISM="Coscinodiscus wailesii, Strain CCMP2513" /LENGTH=113 /DNA_ID=CAMNT_0013297297 /DNA_START=47 /DNA_END=388 /DNA_ORIENTATION=-